MEEEIEKRKKGLKEFFFGWVNDNYDKLFIAILILAFILRLWIFLKTMNQPLWYDEASYLVTGKKWGLGLNINDLWYYRRGFLWPLVSAIFFKLSFGETGIRFLIVLFSTGIVAVSYFLIKRMFNKKLAVLTCLALSFSWVYLFFTGRVLTDLPAAFFMLLSMFFFWKGYALKEGNKFLYFFGISFALAVLTRMQSFMFAPAFLIYILLEEKLKFFRNKQLWITFGIFLLFFIPQIIIYSLHYGNPVTDILSHYFGVSGVSAAEPAQRTIATLFDYFKSIPYMLTIPIFVLFILGIFLFFSDLILGVDKLFKNKEIQKKFFILSWVSIPLLILGYITEYVEHRYASAALPFLFLIAIWTLVKMGDLIQKYNQKFTSKKIFIGLFFVLLLLLTINIGAVYSNLPWANSLTENKLSSYLEVQQAGEWIKENSNVSDLIITPSIPQIAYYAERSVYLGDIDFFSNETYFEQLVEETHPKYLVLSAYEQSPDWVYSYPQQHTDKLIPVQVYPNANQPTVIIYQFIYS